MDYSQPGSPIHGILQARILEWIAIPFSRGSSQPRDRTYVSCIADGFFTNWAIKEALEIHIDMFIFVNKMEIYYTYLFINFLSLFFHM